MRARPLSHRHALDYPSVTMSPCTIHEILRLRPDFGRLRLRRVLAAIAFPPPAAIARQTHENLHAVLNPQPARATQRRAIRPQWRVTVTRLSTDYGRPVDNSRSTASSAGNRVMFVRRRLRAGVSFGDFSLAAQRKSHLPADPRARIDAVESSPKAALLTENKLNIQDAGLHKHVQPTYCAVPFALL